MHVLVGINNCSSISWYKYQYMITHILVGINFQKYRFDIGCYCNVRL